jgi:hypothetical protein
MNKKNLGTSGFVKKLRSQVMGLMVNGRIVTNGIMRAVSRMWLNNPSVQYVIL